MHEPLGAGPQLDGADVPGFLQIDGEDKVAEDIATARRQAVRLGHLDDHVRRPHLPSWGELRLGRQIGGPAFGAALLDPLGDQTKLSRGEAAFPEEIAVTRLGRPWGHVAARGDGDDLRSMVTHILVSEQRERGSFSRAVAQGAVLKDQWGYVSIEGDRLGRERQRDGQKRKPFHCRLSIAQPTAFVSGA